MTPGRHSQQHSSPDTPANPQRRRQLAALASAPFLPFLSLSGLLNSANSAKAANAETAAQPLSVLLIGNANYRRGAELLNPLRDLDLLAASFRQRGAQVKTLSNLSSEQMETALGSFFAEVARNNSAVWVGYSGHAVQIDGRNYLQGLDSDFSSPTRVREAGVELDSLCAKLVRSNPSAAVVSIDACRNNPFEPERTRGTVAGLAAQKTRGLCVSFSTAPYTKALDGEAGQHSPYARALADALAGTQRKLLDDVLRDTANQVYARTQQRQIPEYRSALRSQWWFADKGIELRGPQNDAGTAAAKSGGKNREAAFRPDEPQADSRYESTTDTQWERYEQGQLALLEALSPESAEALVMRAQQGLANDDDRISAALLLEEAAHGVARDQIAARKLLHGPAERGNAFAQTLIGESYFATQSFDHAYKWLSVAARTGYLRATGESEETGELGVILGGLLGTHKLPSNPVPLYPTQSLKSFKQMAAPMVSTGNARGR